MYEKIQVDVIQFTSLMWSSLLRYIQLLATKGSSGSEDEE